MPTDDLVRCSSNGVRVRAWRGRLDVAHLTPTRPPGHLRDRDVDDVLNALVAAGVTGALSAAVGPAEEHVFTTAGFEVHERLLLMRHPLEAMPDTPAVPLRRAGRRDREQVLEIDAAAFGDFWQLDAAGLSDAIRATPHARFRVALDGDGDICGYAITGRAGNAGFLQRLAVEPSNQGRAIGQALVLDGLHWLVRRRAEHALVNTQHDNHRAAGLYSRLGFEHEPHDLAVLSWGEAP